MFARISAQAAHVGERVHAAAQLRLGFDGEPIEAFTGDVGRVGRGGLRALDVLLGRDEKGVGEAFPRHGVVLDPPRAVADPGELVGRE